MGVTIIDVARYAEVNKATVSRALRGDPRISAATRQRVWEAAKALGYEPDAGARALSGSKTGIVAAVFRGLDENWTGRFLAGLERIMSRYKKDLIVKSTGGNPRQSSNIMRSLRSRRVEGIIWLDEPDPEEKRNDIPVVHVSYSSRAFLSITLDTNFLMSELERLSPGDNWAIAVTQPGIFCMIRDSLALIKDSDKAGISLLNYIPGPEELGNSSLLVCSEEIFSVSEKSFRLNFPFFEMGSIAGRLYLNAVYSRGVRPATVLVKPIIFRT